MSVSAIVLAGGLSVRMQMATPKPFLPLGDKLIIQYSLDLFCHLPEITEVVVVCPLEYRSYCSSYAVGFADPGPRRQDSVLNGLNQSQGEWICIHDSARPFVNKQQLLELITIGKQARVATLASPACSSLKICEAGWTQKSLDRSLIWQTQTPQFISRKVLLEGFNAATKNNLTVTDDVALAELAGYKAKIVEASARNFKITTAEDYEMALALCHS